MITDIEDTINNGIMHSRESESCVAQPELKAAKKKSGSARTGKGKLFHKLLTSGNIQKQLIG